MTPMQAHEILVHGTYLPAGSPILEQVIKALPISSKIAVLLDGVAAGSLMTALQNHLSLALEKMEAMATWLELMQLKFNAMTSHPSYTSIVAAPHAKAIVNITWKYCQPEWAGESFPLRMGYESQPHP
ncbi:hypothetical protein BDQ17DRAFT_1325207 [Cyathus striatus]|nr:hypothetical protein BDQ17DRAFT_1325207 [Cyathus striatus]